MSDDDLIVRDPDEPELPPESRGRGILRRVRDLGLGLIGAAALFVFVGWLRAPNLPAEAPGFTLTSLSGSTVSLSELRGRTVVLNFWATWCGPCQMEMPTLLSFAAEHPETPVLFLAVDGSPEKLRAFATAHGLPLDHVVPLDAATRAAYQPDILPTTVVVGPDGEVRGVHSSIVLAPQLWWMTR